MAIGHFPLVFLKKERGAEGQNEHARFGKCLATDGQLTVECFFKGRPIRMAQRTVAIKVPPEIQVFKHILWQRIPAQIAQLPFDTEGIEGDPKRIDRYRHAQPFHLPSEGIGKT